MDNVRYVITTETGRVYHVDLEDSFWSRAPQHHPHRIFSIQASASMSIPSEYNKDKWHEGLPEVGEHMYISSTNEWYVSTKVVSIEELQVIKLEGPEFEAIQEILAREDPYICNACHVAHDLGEERQLGMVCGRCNTHTGNNQGHYWAICSALMKKGVPYKEAMREFHFCCPDDCELEKGEPMIQIQYETRTDTPYWSASIYANGYDMEGTGPTPLDAVIALAEVGGQTRMTRLEVNINDETALAIRQLMKDKDITATEVIRRAVSELYFFEGHLKNGKKIQLVTKAGRVQEIKKL